MAAIKERAERWIFTKEQLENTPSRKHNIDAEKELSYRQQAANLVQDMGQRLQVTQLCINTAIVYMHRFYMFNSMAKFHRNSIAPACLFLAAKVEEQPRKLEHVVGVAHRCLNRDAPALTPNSEKYLEKAQELVIDENILLQTLGFDITVVHPHTHVVKTCQLVRASKDLAQTSYFLATNSLHLSMMCLTVKPTVVACVAIHLACKWSSWELPKSSEGKDWWWYVEKSVTKQMLEELTADFLNIIERCPTRLKGKIMTWKSGKREDLGDAALDQFKDSNSPLPGTSAKPSPRPDLKPSPHPHPVKPSPLAPKKEDKRSPSHADSYKEHKEKRERERQMQLLKKPNGASTDPKRALGPERPRPGQPGLEHRHRKDDRPKPELQDYDRSRPDQGKRPDGRRPDRPELKPDMKPRPGGQLRPEDRRPELDLREGRPGQRPRHDERRSDVKRPDARPKQEEGLRVRDHPKKLETIKPLRPEKKEEPKDDVLKPDLTSTFDDLFGDTASPTESMDMVAAAIEEELKSTEALIVETPPGADFGIDSNILDLMATPPPKSLEKPDFRDDREEIKIEQKTAQLNREREEKEHKERIEKEKREKERREREDRERREAEERERQREERERREREERERREREERERRDKEERDRREKEERERRERDDRRRELIAERSDPRNRLTVEEIKKLEEEPSPYKKERLYPPKRKETKPTVPFTKELQTISTSLPAESIVKKEVKPMVPGVSQPNLLRTDVLKKEESRSLTPTLTEKRVTEHTEPIIQSQSEEKPSLKVRISKPHSSKHEDVPDSPADDAPAPIPKLKINSSAGTVEPLKLKISKDRLGKERHKEKKKHKKDDERHRHKHKSKSKHDHDREHKSRKRAHSPGFGEGSESKARRHSESNGGTVFSPNMQPVVELQKISDAQIRRSSSSKSPGVSSSPVKRFQPQ